MNTDRCNCRIVHQDKVDLAKAQSLTPDKIEKISNLFKACAEPGRLQILYALQQQEMCVCDLAAMLSVSESAVSHQLRLLRTMGLVVNRREGTVLYYRSVDRHISQLIALALEILTEKSSTGNRLLSASF
jgi:ArsR family transcriptional regulator, lead/cadmium/zinc/bismuth-responsive transcriptional repressor